MNKLIARFTFIILVSFIVVQPALSKSNDTVNLLDHPCSISVGKSDFGKHTTKACLELVKEFESKNITNEDYLIALNYLAISALRNADYGIADSAYDKAFIIIEKNKIEINPIIKMDIISSYLNYLVLHKDTNLAKILIKKYLVQFKKIPTNTKLDEWQKIVNIVFLENSLAEINVGRVDTSRKELQDAKIIFDNHLEVAIPMIEEFWRILNVKEHEILNLRLKTLMLYGNLLRRLGDDQEGLNYKIKAVNLAKNKMLPRQQANAYQDIAKYYHIWLKNYENAIKYYKDSIDIFEKDPVLQKDFLYLLTLDGLALCYWFLDQPEKGYEYSKKIADIGLKRLYGKVDISTLFSVDEELNKTQKRISTHVDNLRRIYFKQRYKNNYDPKKLVEESVYYGQMLPQLKTAQALSYSLNKNKQTSIRFNIVPANLSEIMLMLNEDEALIFFHEPFKKYNTERTEWDETMLQGWIISREYVDMIFYEQSTGYTKISNLLNHLDFSNTNNFSSFPFDLAHNVYKSIFGDYLEKNPSSDKIKKLIIVNDGILHKVPYWALTSKSSSPGMSFKNQPWLAKRYAVTIAPSVRSFVDLRKIKKRVLGVGLNLNKEGLFEITDIYENTYASKNDLEIGDLIVKINEANFINPIQIAKTPNEQHIELLINRNGLQHTITIPPYKNNFQENESNYFDFVGIGNPSGLKGSESKLSNLIKSISFNDFFTDIDDITRGVNKRAIQEMPALPGTEKELKAIARNFDNNKSKLFLQNEATETAIKDADLSNTRYISFASHAIVAGEIGEFDEPGIVLTPPNSSSEEDDGLLTASEITQLKMNADLVILSACNTGAGSDDSPSAEGLTGLARSFFIAGNKELVVSNWRVTDEYAARLTTGMLDYLTTKENVTKAEALQYSINELIDENLHPIFWAPFMLVGDGL